MRALPLLLLGLVLFTWPAAAQDFQDFSGTYHGTTNGASTVVQLVQDGNALTGASNTDGHVLSIEGTVEGEAAWGMVYDPASGASAAAEFVLEGAALTMTLVAEDPSTGQVHRIPFAFRRGGPEQKRSSAPAGTSKTAGQGDPQLVGLWAHQEVMTGGGISVATQIFMAFREDGTFAQGDARTVGSGADWSGDTGTSGETTAGRWRTEGGVLHGLVDGVDRWTPVARYYVEGDRLMLTYENGTREVWYRQ